MTIRGPIMQRLSRSGVRVTLAATTLTALALGTAAVPASAQIPVEEYAARREALAARIDSGVVVAFGGAYPVNHWPPFYQLPAFRYLTGFLESDAAFTLVKRGDGTITSTLYVTHADPRRALYDGDRATPQAAAEALGLDASFLEELEPYVDGLVAGGLPVYSVADFQSSEFSQADSLTPGRTFVSALESRHPGLEVPEINGWVDLLRARKSEAEQELLRRAAEHSSRAHEAAMRTIKPGVRENEIQAVMEAEYRKLGSDRPGYSSIVGSGPNSTVLHYPAGTRAAKAGEVVLMDVAAYFDGYSADITRTVPVNRTFTEEQKDVYRIVLAAQKAAEAEISDGVARSAPTQAAYAVLIDGLVRLGLIESADATFDPPPGLCPGTWANADGSCPQWYLYVYHGFIHGIGLDVHDPSVPRTFEQGEVFTIEPGIYVRERVFDDLPDTDRNRQLIGHAGDAALRYRNVGVRIEDNYILTSQGLVRITDVPREIEEIEALRRNIVM
jgi:Xaa-Pro aminopeptidase